MIGKLTGKLIAQKPPMILLEVAGVGYELALPMFSLYRLPELGQMVSLYTHLIVREDALQLYGFYQEKERSLFRELIKVNNVGPKLALAILSGIEAERFVFCVQQNDPAALVKIPGVGKKTAERLLLEMRGRLEDFADSASNLSEPAGAEQQQISEAISALVALGYKSRDAETAIRKVQAEGLSSQELIRQALKNMV